MMPRGVFVTGTDTGIGKTLIAGALARVLRSEGIDIGVMKPVETGCRTRKGRLLPADGEYLRIAAQARDPLSFVTPYCFRSPLAPRAASLLEKKKVDFKTILKAYDHLRERHSFLIVEGIGGLMVPLTARSSVIDLILLLDLPVLLVARSGLGTLNHSLLTLDVGARYGIRFFGVLFNQTQPSKTLADRTNVDILSEKMDVPFLGSLPYFRKTGVREKDIELSKKLILKNCAVERWGLI